MKSKGLLSTKSIENDILHHYLKERLEEEDFWKVEEEDFSKVEEVVGHVHVRLQMVHFVWALKKWLKNLLKVYLADGKIWGHFFFSLYTDIFGNPFLHSLVKELELEKKANIQQDQIHSPCEEFKENKGFFPILVYFFTLMSKMGKNKICLPKLANFIS